MSLIMPLLSVQITIILLLEILKINNQNCCPPVAIFERKMHKSAFAAHRWRAYSSSKNP